MRCLVVEDDLTSGKVLEKYLSPFGSCDLVLNGEEALSAFEEALDGDSPYTLICLDIMMPKMDGHSVLQKVRALEKERGIEINDGVKVIMTTALSDSSNVLGAFRDGCEAYIVKPIKREQLMDELRKLGLTTDE